MAFHEDNALFGECKWTNSPIGIDVYEDLLEQGKLFHYKHQLYYLFSKRGFIKECIEAATASENVKLITFQELYK